jgi:hypothetical protein
MCQEYISTSRPALLNMAKLLGNTAFNMGDPSVEVEVEVVLPEKDKVEEVAEAQKDTKVELVASEDIDSFLSDLQMEEDPEMYQAAGIPLPSYRAVNNSPGIEQTIQSVISSVPNLQGANVAFKVCVIPNNYGSVDF